MCVFLALSTLYPNDRLSGFAMTTKTCRAARLYQRPLNSPICVKIVSILRDKILVPKEEPYYLWTMLVSSLMVSCQHFIVVYFISCVSRLIVAQ